jgi:beta-aspartyl-peptidase (threonine type)
MEYTGVSLEEAANEVVMNKLVRMDGSGGIISVDPDGNISLTFNTPGMYRASVSKDGELYVGIYRDE